MSTQISHDAFARRSLYRDIVRGKGACDFCGSKRDKRYSYHYVNDDSLSGVKQKVKGMFCNAECMRSYSE